jgi:hypothetical protein
MPGSGGPAEVASPGSMFDALEYSAIDATTSTLKKWN